MYIYNSAIGKLVVDQPIVEGQHIRTVSGDEYIVEGIVVMLKDDGGAFPNNRMLQQYATVYFKQ